MTYSFLFDLFTAILQQSATIEGRFYVSSKNGNEINSDVLGQVLTDVVTQTTTQKYPLVLMTAPTSRGELSAASAWQDYTITLLFLRPSYYDAFNQIADINPNTQTSMRPIMKDWEAMELCAKDFIRVLDVLQRMNKNHNVFRLEKGKKPITPFSNVGIDRVSGVRLDFGMSLFVDCLITDIDTTAAATRVAALLT